MKSFTDEIKCKIKVAEQCAVIGPEAADFHYGYKRALEEVLDDLEFLVEDLRVDVNGDLQKIERMDGDVIVIAASSLQRRLADLLPSVLTDK